MSEPLYMKCNVCGSSWVAKERDLGLEQCPHSAVHSAFAAAVERAERAERERDEWRHRCGCTPECELHCCSQDCDNAGAEEGSWRGAWDLLDEARSALSSALSRAERAEADFAKERAQHITDIQCAERRLMKIEEQRDAALARVDEVERQRDDAIDEARSSDSAEAHAKALKDLARRVTDHADCHNCRPCADMQREAHSLLSSPPPTKDEPTKKENAK